MSQQDHSPTSPLFFLAFDHRSTLRNMFGEEGLARAEDLKDAALEALLEARDAGAPGLDRGAAILIDAELGASAAARAGRESVVLAMPIEQSGAASFTWEYGGDTLDRLEEFEIDYAKALVFVNPEEGDAYKAEIADLAEALAETAARGHRVMLEILVPATADQLRRAGGDTTRYDAELRPELVAQVIGDCYEAGMKPELWKLEGLESSEDAKMVSAEIAARDPRARSLILGRWERDERVEHWLRVAAGTPGFDGFAIGRSIWEPEFKMLLAGEHDRETAVGRIAERYSHFVGAYMDARASANVGS